VEFAVAHYSFLELSSRRIKIKGFLPQAGQFSRLSTGNYTDVKLARSTFYMVRASSAKFGLYAGKMNSIHGMNNE
jgi:hypothetical protein